MSFLRRTVSLCLFVLLSACPLVACKTDVAFSDSNTETDMNEKPVTEEIETKPETEPETEADTTPVAPFFACLYTGNLTESVSGQYDSLDAAIEAVKKKAYLGLRVCDSTGRLVWAPYTELQCDLLREAKWVTDYVRENRFKYGDAPINPAINNAAKKVSCDRLVCWVYYRVGYTNQPQVQGLVVSNFFTWCEKMGFEKITKLKDLQPGDIVGVRPSSNGKYPQHVFMYAGAVDYDKGYRGRGNCLRYDCGSDTRIQSVQPFTESISDFMCAYRPVKRDIEITKLSTNTSAELDLSNACELYAAVRDATWTDATAEADYTYTFVIEGKTYQYASGNGTVQDTETGKVFTMNRDWRSNFRMFVRKAFVSDTE